MIAAEISYTLVFYDYSLKYQDHIKVPKEFNMSVNRKMGRFRPVKRKTVRKRVRGSNHSE